MKRKQSAPICKLFFNTTFKEGTLSHGTIKYNLIINNKINKNILVDMKSEKH